MLAANNNQRIKDICWELYEKKRSDLLGTEERKINKPSVVRSLFNKSNVWSKVLT